MTVTSQNQMKPNRRLGQSGTQVGRVVQGPRLEIGGVPVALKKCGG